MNTGPVIGSVLQITPVPTGVVDDFDLSTITTADLVFALVALALSLFIAEVTKRTLRRVLDDLEGMPVQAADVIARIVSYMILLFGLVVAMEALGFSLGPVASILLIVVITVVVAAKPLLQDLGAGLIIQIRHPFRIGDQIVIEGEEGQVDEVSARTVRLIAVDGRRIHLPNRVVLDGSIVNLTAEGQRMSTFLVGLAYDTDLDRAQTIIVEVLMATPLVLDDPAPQALVHEFAASTIDVACRFWHRPEVEAAWAAKDQAMRAVKRGLDDAGIAIAFPQRVLWRGIENSLQPNRNPTAEFAGDPDVG